MHAISPSKSTSGGMYKQYAKRPIMLSSEKNTGRHGHDLGNSTERYIDTEKKDRSPFGNRTNLSMSKFERSLSPQQKYQNTIDTYKSQIENMRTYLRQMEGKTPPTRDSLQDFKVDLDSK